MPDVFEAAVERSRGFHFCVAPGRSRFEFQNVDAGACVFQVGVEGRRQRAEANTDAKIGVALEFADEGEGDFTNRDRVFAGLNVKVGDAGRAMIDDELGELVEVSAETAEAPVGAAHAAVMTILPAIIGNLEHSADENFLSETVARGLRSPFVKFLLRRRVSRS